MIKVHPPLQAPSAEPLSDMADVPLAAASAPDQTEQRGTGAAEAEATVTGEEADDSGAQEGDEDWSSGASCAEGGQHQIMRWKIIWEWKMKSKILLNKARKKDSLLCYDRRI